MGHLRGEWEVCAKGGKRYGFVNALQQKAVCCRNQRCVGEAYYFRCTGKEKKVVEELAKAYGVTITATERRTLHQILYRYRMRFGIPLGLLLSGGLLFYCSNIVMEIQVIGNETASTAEIIAILAECGVTRGTWIPSIGFSGCEHAIRAGVEELAWVGMRHTGNRLVIEVLEADAVPELLEERVPSNIVAAQDGQIVSVSVACGQLMKLVGEPVRKGDLLVSGVTTDEKGHIAIRHALGEIIGQYELTQTFTCAYQQQVSTLTGEKQVVRYLDLFTWHIPLESGVSLETDSVQTTSHCWFFLLGKALPVGIYRETYYPRRTKTLYYTPEEASRNLSEQETRYRDNFLQDVEILDKETAVLETENGLEWNVTYTLQGEIGVQQELWIKDH